LVWNASWKPSYDVRVQNEPAAVKVKPFLFSSAVNFDFSIPGYLLRANSATHWRRLEQCQANP